MQKTYRLSQKEPFFLQVKDIDYGNIYSDVEDVNLKKIFLNYEKEIDKLNYARNLYVEILNGKSYIARLGPIIINSSKTTTNLTESQKREVMLFVHNRLFKTEYKMENLVNSNGEAKDFEVPNVDKEDAELIKQIRYDVKKYMDERFQNYYNSRYEGGKVLKSGFFGKVYLFKSMDSNNKFVRKVPTAKNESSHNFIRESNITEEIGVIGGVSRQLRRTKKGYGDGVRLPVPQVFNKGKHIEMEFLEKGDMAVKQDSIDIYDFLKQTCKLVKDLHVNGYIHRDIKPENILLGTDVKIRLADMDSVIKKELMNPKEICGTYTYFNEEVYANPFANRDKIDIYSIGVSALVILLGPKKYNEIRTKIHERLLRNPNAYRDDIDFQLKSKDLFRYEVLKYSERYPDNHLGILLSNMLNNKYESIKQVLIDIENNPTVQDKKDLKIVLSYIEDENKIKKTLKLIKHRNNLCQKLFDKKHRVFAPQRRFIKQKLNNVNIKISEELMKECEGLSEQKKDHIIKIVEKLKTNEFSKIPFIITPTAINSQKSKNISIEKLSKRSDKMLCFTK